MGIFKKLFGSEGSDLLKEIEAIENEEETLVIDKAYDETEEDILDESDDIDEDFEEVTIEELQEELTEDGEFSYDDYDKVCCPECGQYLGEGVTVCKTCGYGKIVNTFICPNCGKTDEDHLGFCAYCDYQFDTKESK